MGSFVLGVDLDGVVADYYSRLREIAAEWFDRPLDELPVDPKDISEWGIDDQEEYERIHHFAVTERKLFATMQPIDGAPRTLRILSNNGVRIRIVTHRIMTRRIHEPSIIQTVKWLDNYGIPYWDICFLGEKSAVDADCFIDDTPEQINHLAKNDKRVIVYTNFTNTQIEENDLIRRANNWKEVKELVAKLRDQGSW
jgi:5'(3')-deoxyribonucleotidase